MAACTRLQSFHLSSWQVAAEFWAQALQCSLDPKPGEGRCGCKAAVCWGLQNSVGLLAPLCGTRSPKARPASFLPGSRSWIEAKPFSLGGGRQMLSKVEILPAPFASLQHPEQQAWPKGLLFSFQLGPHFPVAPHSRSQLPALQT